jgi:hypothetical protein
MNCPDPPYHPSWGQRVLASRDASAEETPQISPVIGNPNRRKAV